MLQISALRLLAQLSSLLVVLSLREISLGSVGLYAIHVSVISMLSAFLTYEGTFFVISRNLRPSRFFANLKANRVVWLISLLALFAFQGPNIEILVCLMGFLVALDSDYLINIITMGKRVFGNSELFKKLLHFKIVITELLIPALSASAVYFGYSLFVAAIYCVVWFLINGYLLRLALRKSANTSLGSILPDLKGVIMATLKRGDSQFYRLLIGSVFGTSILGQIYPALILGRAGSILGNIWYTWYFKEIEPIRRTSSTIWKYKILILFMTATLAIVYSGIAQPIILLAADWDVEPIIYALFFIINVQFFLKTFLRLIALNTRQANKYNTALAGSLGVRCFAILGFSYSMEHWLIICILMDLIFFMLLQKFLTDQLKED